MCSHKNKVYSPRVVQLLCYPPTTITAWICKDCGEEGEERHREVLDTEYDQTKEKWRMK